MDIRFSNNETLADHAAFVLCIAIAFFYFEHVFLCLRLNGKKFSINACLDQHLDSSVALNYCVGHLLATI